MAAIDTIGRYVADFERFSTNGASRSPQWVQKLRADGLARFEQLGFPTQKLEAWRFTSVRELVATEFSVASAISVPRATIERERLTDGSCLVFVNGIFARDLSSIDELPNGVIVGDLATATHEHASIVEASLGKIAPMDLNGFTALNTAFIQDGAFVYVPKNKKLSRPVEIMFVTANDGSEISHPRSLIVTEDGAELEVVESYCSVSDTPYFVNPVTEIVVGDNARVEVYRVQRDNDLSYHVAATHSTQGRNSVYALHAVPFGSHLMRHDIRMVMNGEGGEGTLNGLYLMRGTQHIDHNTVIEHAKPHCDSHEYFNGILADDSHSVFNGRIVVQPGAQKTDSKQTNNNLLLSDTARADSQPQLEIYADDVRCTHGATMGPIDENALFYLQSRGISADAAKGMLTYGFGTEILGRMGSDAVRNRLDQMVRQRLAESIGVRTVS